MKLSEEKIDEMVFDYHFLRGLIGVVAFFLGPIVNIKAGEDLSSISASYYTGAIDVFVGLLFFVSAFLCAYNGHTKLERLISTIAAICAIGIAIFPTDLPSEDLSLIGGLHYFFAVLMFAILSYFCLKIFAPGAKQKDQRFKGNRNRYYAYKLCGYCIILSMVGYALIRLIWGEGISTEFRVLFYAEAIALASFGIAWSISSKLIPLFKENV